MPRPGELHAHKCGYSPTDLPEIHGKGCGHVFVHRKPVDAIGDEAYDRLHLCPVCKMGPWKNPWSTEFEELWDSTPQSIQTELREAVRRKKAEDRAIATFFSNFDLPFESER